MTANAVGKNLRMAVIERRNLQAVGILNGCRQFIGGNRELADGLRRNGIARLGAAPRHDAPAVDLGTHERRPKLALLGIADRELGIGRKQKVGVRVVLQIMVNVGHAHFLIAAQQRAEAELYQRQKDAEAKQFEAQREAEAQKAQAEAMRFAREQEAAGIRAVGEAEASAIQAKGIAEAEAMEKKAEAYAKYNKAAVAEMMIKVLPEIAGKIAEPLSQIDKITIIGGGSEDNGIGSVAGNVPVVMAKLFESMKEATGVDLSEIMRADTYDAKVNRNIQISSPEELKEYLKAEAGKAAADAESPEKAEASEPVQKDGSEQ